MKVYTVFKRILLPAFFYISFYSPALPQIGKTFWFAVPNVNSSHADEPLSLNISTFDAPATVTVSIPANPAFTPLSLTIPANSFGVIPLECHSDNRANPPHFDCQNNPVNFKALLETDVLNTIQNKGLLITSTSDITVYYEVTGSNCNASRCKVANADIFSLKGDNALGTDFFVPWQTGHPLVIQDFWDDNLGGMQGTSLYIVATQNATDIDITPSVNLLGGATAGNTFSITLDSGQTYALQSAGSSGPDHLAGTHLVSDKPIAVTVIDDSPADRNDFAANGNKAQVYDLVGDQLIPLTHAGTEFVVSDYYAYVTCTEDNTNISITTSSGTSNVTRNKGQTHEVNLTSISGPAYIQTDKPVLLFHLRGIDGLNNYPEFGGAVVPSLKCTGSRTVRFSRSTEEYQEQFFLTLLVRNTGTGNFTLNGNPSLISASDFVPVPGSSDLMYCEKAFSVTEIPPFQTSTVSNSTDAFHLGVIYGRPYIDQVNPADSVSTGCRYGYFSNFGAADIHVNVDNTCLTPGDDLSIDPGDFDQYFWYKNGNPLSTSPVLSVSQSGDYSLKVIDQTGCSDSTGFTVNLGIIPDFKINNDTTLCPDERHSLHVMEGTAGDHSVYNWYFIPKGTTTPILSSHDTILTAEEPGMYILEAVTPGCGSHSDTVFVDYWDVFIPNLITPNGDGHNDQFYIPGTEKGKWTLTIVNRWGDKIYQSEQYDNSWDASGTYTEKEGVYFFYLQEENTKMCNVYKGWVKVEK